MLTMTLFLVPSISAVLMLRLPKQLALPRRTVRHAL
jgi:hypothetical protein